MRSTTTPQVAQRALELEFARAARTGRMRIGWSQRELGARVGLSQSEISKLEHGLANPTMRSISRVAVALGIDVSLATRQPYVDERQRDAAHARCVSHAQRRLGGAGWIVEREVEIVTGRARGWIDLLAVEPNSGSVLVIEIKTQLVDLGAVERQVAWYEREAWPAARRLGWRPRLTAAWLLVLATEAADARIRDNHDGLATTFPVRAPSMAAFLAGDRSAMAGGRGLALIDPRSRRRPWLLRVRVDGRRAPAPYADYADFMRRLGGRHVTDA